MGCVLLDLVVVVVGVLMLAAQTAALPNGAPPQACIEMIPGHGAQGIGTVPYAIDIEGSPDNIYMAGQLVTVRVRPVNANKTFRGLLMQMRRYDSMDPMPVGSWRPKANGTYIGTRTLTCNGTDDSITHIMTDHKSVAEFTWMAPLDLAAATRLQVRATVAEGMSLWWRGITSDVLTYSAGMAPCPVYTLVVLLSAATVGLRM